MTPQTKILTTMNAGQKSNGEVVINPFYGATEKEINDNITYARNVYDDVFRRFISTWFLRGDSDNAPPREWATLEI